MVLGLGSDDKVAGVPAFAYQTQWLSSQGRNRGQNYDAGNQFGQGYDEFAAIVDNGMKAFYVDNPNVPAQVIPQVHAAESSVYGMARSRMLFDNLDKITEVDEEYLKEIPQIGEKRAPVVKEYLPDGLGAGSVVENWIKGQGMFQPFAMFRGQPYEDLGEEVKKLREEVKSLKEDLKEESN